MTAHKEQSDESLMGRIQRRDQQAFSTLVQRHSERFYFVAYRTIADREEAEDIVQEAFLKLWHNPKSWKADKGVKFTTWFYRVVTNLSIDKVRGRKSYASSDFLEQWQDERQSQEADMIARQEQAMLEEAIQSLPEKQKTALNLCFYEGLSNKEASEIMGVGVKALESLLMRAKAGIRDTLIREGIIKTGEVA